MLFSHAACVSLAQLTVILWSVMVSFSLSYSREPQTLAGTSTIWRTPLSRESWLYLEVAEAVKFGVELETSHL